ncbi:MAG: molybdopterin-dependent oxidoreductase [Acidobacteria bacterium]|nr:molybdopterin-dependent oxidoreductase [Acidobacteriota bacterium]MBV9068667.1 molybdopterin-dependent oxidoreductase [Acidobacteriota bacterium]MBV9185499.1 molybdopterin-dependent oxidoreductase [Acidobacteriota bacterium]
MNNVRIAWNGHEVEREVRTETTLQQLLHDELDDISVKAGCGEGVCGSCTVLLDNEPVASCIRLALQAAGRAVTTAAGLVELPDAAALIEHLVAREAFQCGYCAPGFLVSAVHALNKRRPLSADEVRIALSGNICRCTGYQQIVDAVVAASSGEPPPPAIHARQDLFAKIRGEARYATDVRPADVLFGRIVWSDQSSAILCGLDTSAASAVPGVVAVLTAADIPGVNITGMQLFGSDHPLLCDERVRSTGDAIAVVAATSAAAAREAVRRLRPTTAPLAAVHDFDSAGDICSQFVKVRGDIAIGFAAADEVIEDTYEMTAGDHACMEREAGFGWIEGDTIVLSVTTLTPHLVRGAVARVLDLPESRVRVETPRMGGSFGKYLMPGLEGYLALLVYATRRPVRLVLDRDESIARSTKRHAFRARYRLGVKRDGTFTALDAEILADAGPYVGLTPTVVAVLADEAAGAYDFPHLSVRARGVLTNNLLATAMRGFGSQQVAFGIESIVEKAARTLELDPAEVRRRNFCRNPENALAESVDEVVRRLGARPAAAPGWLTGRGIGSIKAKYGYPYGLVDSTVVRLSVDDSGELMVEADIADSGTGIIAALPRLAAVHLGVQHLPRYLTSSALLDDPSGILLTRGIPPCTTSRWIFRTLEKMVIVPTALALSLAAHLRPRMLSFLLRVVARPTDVYNAFVATIKERLFPAGVDSYLPRTSASRGLAMAGRAVCSAAERFRAAAISRAAVALDVPESRLAITNDGVYDTSAPHRRVSWKQLAPLAAIGRVALRQGGLFEPATGNQSGPVDHMFATHGCDLAIHPETGEVRILRYVACQDVGRALDPETVRGQIVGGVAMGVSQTLYEHLGQAGGKVNVVGLHEYHVVTTLDAPWGLEVINLETGSGFGPSGAKGVGEAGCVAAPPTLANALYDALGRQMTHISVSPEELTEFTH